MLIKGSFYPFFGFILIISCISQIFSQDAFIIQNIDIIDIPIQQNTTANIITFPTWLGQSQSQYKKFMSDRYNYYITPTGNKVWVCVMSLAWNQLKHEILFGNNPNFANMTELQSHMVDSFNQELFTKHQLSQKDYYVHAGYGQQTIMRINFDVKQKFPLRTLPQLDYQLTQNDFISFAYLFKNFQYPTPFSDKGTFYFNDIQVQAFQTKTSKQRNQLYYKYFNSSSDFMIGIKTKNNIDQIILWKTDVKQINELKIDKLLHVFDMYYQQQSKSLGMFDHFIMPVIELDYTKKYGEFIDLNFTNPELQGVQIKTMEENLKVKVTKSGVRLQAQGVIVGLRSLQIVDKQFYLNSDFWLIMKEKNKLPYLVTKIVNVNQTWVS